MHIPGWWNKLIAPAPDTAPIDLEEISRKRAIREAEIRAVQEGDGGTVLRVSGRYPVGRRLPALVERSRK